MDETRRTYDFQGQVTISSQEYADLVQDFVNSSDDIKVEYKLYLKNKEIDE